MKVIKPAFTIESFLDEESILKHLERIGRTAYKSEDMITEKSASSFVKMLLRKKQLR